ncbi:MAG: DinB family protein [Chloroflexota bacterium]
MPEQAEMFSLKSAYQDFVEVILPLSDEEFLSPMDGWSPRDVVAHLVGWNSFMIEASSSILAGKPPAYYDDAPNDYSNINAGFVMKHSSRSKQELLAELESSMQAFEAFLLALPAGELAAEHGVRHYSGSPATVGRTVEALAGDYRHHTRQISAWLHDANH